MNPDALTAEQWRTMMQNLDKVFATKLTRTESPDEKAPTFKWEVIEYSKARIDASEENDGKA